MIRQKKLSDKTYNSKFCQDRFMETRQGDLNDIKLYKKAYVENIESVSDLRDHCSVYCVRYNNDFLLGLRVDKRTAKTIINEIQVFVKSDIHIECRDPSFKSGSSELFRFLGFNIGGCSSRFNKKSQHLIRLNKIRTSLQRKKIAESEKYFRLVEQMSSKMHRRILNSVSNTGQIVFKQLQHKNWNNRSVTLKVLNALKLSLHQMESEVSMLPTTPNISKACTNTHRIPTFVG